MFPLTREEGALDTGTAVDSNASDRSCHLGRRFPRLGTFFPLLLARGFPSSNPTPFSLPSTPGYPTGDRDVERDREPNEEEEDGEEEEEEEEEVEELRLNTPTTRFVRTAAAGGESPAAARPPGSMGMWLAAVKKVAGIQ